MRREACDEMMGVEDWMPKKCTPANENIRADVGAEICANTMHHGKLAQQRARTLARKLAQKLARELARKLAR